MKIFKTVFLTTIISCVFAINTATYASRLESVKDRDGTELSFENIVYQDNTAAVYKTSRQIADNLYEYRLYSVNENGAKNIFSVQGPRYLNLRLERIEDTFFLIQQDSSTKNLFYKAYKISADGNSNELILEFDRVDGKYEIKKVVDSTAKGQADRPQFYDIVGTQLQGDYSKVIFDKTGVDVTLDTVPRPEYISPWNSKANFYYTFDKKNNKFNIIDKTSQRNVRSYRVARTDFSDIEGEFTTVLSNPKADFSVLCIANLKKTEDGMTYPYYLNFYAFDDKGYFKKLGTIVNSYKTIDCPNSEEMVADNKYFFTVPFWNEIYQVSNKSISKVKYDQYNDLYTGSAIFAEDGLYFERWTTNDLVKVNDGLGTAVAKWPTGSERKYFGFVDGELYFLQKDYIESEFNFRPTEENKIYTLYKLDKDKKFQKLSDVSLSGRDVEHIRHSSNGDFQKIEYDFDVIRGYLVLNGNKIDVIRSDVDISLQNRVQTNQDGNFVSALAFVREDANRMAINRYTKEKGIEKITDVVVDPKFFEANSNISVSFYELGAGKYLSFKPKGEPIKVYRIVN